MNITDLRFWPTQNHYVVHISITPKKTDHICYRKLLLTGENGQLEKISKTFMVSLEHLLQETIVNRWKWSAWKKHLLHCKTTQNYNVFLCDFLITWSLFFRNITFEILDDFPTKGEIRIMLPLIKMFFNWYEG